MLRGTLHLLVKRRPGISASEACRIINGRTLDECIYVIRCKYYLNPRRRRKGARKPPCIYNLARVRRTLKALEREGKLVSFRERIPDHRQPRGWDYARLYYPVDRVPPRITNFL